MVEVTQTMFRRILIYALGAVFLTAGGVRAQQPEVEARIAGLEGNAEYMSLLREDAQLQIREDSIVNAVERMRRQLREDPGKRQQYSQEILQLESRIFEIRNAKGRLIDRINTIEQEWVLASLNGAAQQPAASAEKSPAEAVPDSLKVRNLVDNLYFREHLPAEDYAALRDAQRQEMRAVDYVNRYFANHDTLTELAETYAAVQTEAEAMEVFERYNALQGVNRALADSLAATWNSIFDNKSYAYGYLLDKMGEEEVLAREEEALSEASRQLSALQGETASDAVADYFLRKRVVVDYEAAVAGVLALDAARDSLRGVAAQLRFDLGGILTLDAVLLQRSIGGHQLYGLRQVIARKTVDGTRLIGCLFNHSGNAAARLFHPLHRSGKLRVRDRLIQLVQCIQIGGNAVEHRVHILTAGSVGDQRAHHAGGAELCPHCVGDQAQPRKNQQVRKAVRRQQQRPDRPHQRRHINGQHRAFGFFLPFAHAGTSRIIIP